MIKGWIEVFMRRLMARYCEANNLALQKRVEELEGEMKAIREKAESLWGTTGADRGLREIADQIRERLGW